MVQGHRIHGHLAKRSQGDICTTTLSSHSPIAFGQTQRQSQRTKCGDDIQSLISGQPPRGTGLRRRRSSSVQDKQKTPRTNN